MFVFFGKGVEYFMKYFLGVENGFLVKVNICLKFEIMVWYDEDMIGKFDLVVDMDFWMVLMVMYFDVVLLVVIWYEKEDLLLIDMYFYIYLFNKVISLMWELCFDW